MQRFQESDINFTLAPSWVVRKYDDHTFFRGLSGFGLKGVDFIALLPDGRLGLIEVKNYHPRPDKVNGTVHPIKRKKAADLAKNLDQKYHDTLRAIRVVGRYYRTKWFYRWRFQLLYPFERLANSDLYFWKEASRRADGPIPVVIILWLETPKAAKKYRGKIYAYLSSRLEPEEGQLLLGGNGFSPLPGISAHRINKAK
ncbi:hypothetical protein CEQ90_01980 [Lewinellaceae bacterium SD302]|nr:hypothetical protein CEQ90_01980 [Lewinellaceae bacterium SD302]